MSKKNKNQYKEWQPLSEVVSNGFNRLSSNIRLSIVYRISLNYMGIFFRSAFSILLFFIVSYAVIETGFLWNKGSEATKMITQLITINEEQLTRNNSGIIYDELTKLSHEGIGVLLTNKTSNQQIYNHLIVEDNFENILFNYIDNKRRIIFEYNDSFISTEGTLYEIYYQFDLTQEGNKLLIYIILLSIFLFIETSRIPGMGKKGTERVLSPIAEMSYTANRLSASNLSERINVAGTKNELKDLAMIINNMLDRIEISYDSQKQFVSDASHELRTPIAVIQGYANLLDRWGKTDKEVMEESIEAIKNESIEMQALVEKLLFLARHDKKTLHLEKEVFDIGELIEDMVRDTKLIVKNREVIGDDIDNINLYGDKQAIKQGIRVFIDNAVKYTPDNGTITISCKREGTLCVITVSDTGMGMSAEDLNNIFNRFYRSEMVRNEKITGHGLGLSIAKLIILGHEGKINVRSKIGEGSSFIISFPI